MAARYRPAGFWTRVVIAVALTAMPILFVYCAQGPWQIDCHMYFFAFGRASSVRAERLSVMSVNVSSRQLTQQSFLTDLETVLRETGAKPDHLQLEITESVLLNNTENVGRTLLRLQAL